MFSGHKIVIYWLIALCLDSLYLLHLDAETLTFIDFFHVTEALLRRRCREAKSYVTCPALLIRNEIFCLLIASHSYGAVVLKQFHGLVHILSGQYMPLFRTTIH